MQGPEINSDGVNGAEESASSNHVNPLRNASLGGALVISMRGISEKNECITAELDLQRGQVSFSAKGKTIGIIEGVSGDGLRFFCYFDGIFDM